MKRSDYTHFALQIILFFTSLSTDLNAQENEAAPVQETALEETEEPSELKMTVVTAERPVPTRLKPEVPRTFVQPVVIDDDFPTLDPTTIVTTPNRVARTNFETPHVVDTITTAEIIERFDGKLAPMARACTATQTTLRKRLTVDS